MGGTFRSSTTLTELQADKEKQITQSAIVTIHYLINNSFMLSETQSPSKITYFWITEKLILSLNNIKMISEKEDWKPWSPHRVHKLEYQQHSWPLHPTIAYKDIVD